MRASTLPLALVAALAALPALAAETGGCGAFAWPIEPDKALLAAAPVGDSGGRLDLTRPAAVRLVLTNAAKAGFELPPGRPAAPAAPAGVLRFEAKAGLHQITTTERVWIDVVQAGKRLDEAGFSGVLDCEGARKSVRFQLQEGPATIQISGSPSRTVGIAVTALPQ
ncbi:hypothetical protein [Methylopila sp. 73B]|uniref:hypothetical protein n=1 Tax=Methylopila sp. 73B TaxID=1120792 RepID=UPI00037C1474|nr:hypothetical protein [Methylopila sp. 73B]